MYLKKNLFILLILVCNFGFAQSEEIKHILFIGNSLTYSNDLPRLVKVEAKKKDITIRTKMVAFPNYGLEDHWNDGEVQKLIKKNNYDFVVIQQGPSSQAYGRSSLLEFGGKLKTICENNNTKLVYFMVWPSRQYYYTFDGVIKNHTDAAKKNDALLCPVGSVWKTYFDDSSDFSYYGNDGFHPSLKGSKVAAKVIVNTLFSR